MIKELTGDTTAHGAVMATRPARAPFIVILASGFPYFAHTVNIAASAPVAAARLVFNMIIPIAPFVPARVLPPLNPNHPNQRMKVPRAARGMLCPGIGLGFP